MAKQNPKPKMFFVNGLKNLLKHSLVIVRPSVVFGPTNRGNVHTLMDQIVKGRFLMVGDGEIKIHGLCRECFCVLTHALSFGNGYHVFLTMRINQT